jgi:hypothetical protein
MRPGGRTHWSPPLRLLAGPGRGNLSQAFFDEIPPAAAVTIQELLPYLTTSRGVADSVGFRTGISVAVCPGGTLETSLSAKSTRMTF